MNSQHQKGISAFVHSIDKSALFTVIGILILFSMSIIVILWAPRYLDPSWTTPSSPYQVQMYEMADPNFYISSAASGTSTLQFVYHVKNNYTLLSFQESRTIRIIAPSHLEKFVTKSEDPILKLTSRLLLLRKPQKTEKFDAIAESEKRINESASSKNGKELAKDISDFEIFELYEPDEEEAFIIGPSDQVVENWVDADFKILDETIQHPFHAHSGVIYINNPREYRHSKFAFNDREGWHYDPEGVPLKNLADLKTHALGFRSRAELIALGEHIYAIEGCWYCHTDQTRTLVQDVVLNGSDSYPAPPSSANEYIYQRITFPGTRRIGPDLSRVGIKRPSRDWHKGHFWSPRTASEGSIMPSFRHFFDFDPRGTTKNTVGIPNYKFEAIYQYLMTKGTRITPPNQAWWLGLDPIQTKEIIEGNRRLPR